MNAIKLYFLFGAISLLLANIGITVNFLGFNSSYSSTLSNESTILQNDLTNISENIYGSLMTTDIINTYKPFDVTDIKSHNMNERQSLYDNDDSLQVIENNNDVYDSTQKQFSKNLNEQINLSKIKTEINNTSEFIIMKNFENQCGDILDKIMSFNNGLGIKEIHLIKDIKDKLTKVISSTLYDEDEFLKKSMTESRNNVESIIIRLSKIGYYINKKTRGPRIAIYAGSEYNIDTNIEKIMDLSHETMTKILKAHYKDYQFYKGFPRYFNAVSRLTYNKFVKYIMRISIDAQSYRGCYGSIKMHDYEDFKIYEERYLGISDIILSHLFFLTLDREQRSISMINNDDIMKHTKARIIRMNNKISSYYDYSDEIDNCLRVPIYHNIVEIYTKIDTWLKEDMDVRF